VSLNFTVKNGLLKVTGSHVHWKSDNISETVVDRDVLTTGHQQEVKLVYGLSNSSNCNDLGCLWRSFHWGMTFNSPIASLIKCDISCLWRVARSLCIYRASCRFFLTQPSHISMAWDVAWDYVLSVWVCVCLQTGKMARYFGDLELFALLVACLAHNIGFRGVSYSMLVRFHSSLLQNTTTANINDGAWSSIQSLLNSCYQPH